MSISKTLGGLKYRQNGTRGSEWQQLTQLNHRGNEAWEHTQDQEKVTFSLIPANCSAGFKAFFAQRWANRQFFMA